MKLKKLFSLALVGISALTGAFMLTGCGKTESKPAEVKALDSAIADSLEQDFTVTISTSMEGTDGDGEFEGYVKYDKGNQVIELNLMEYDLYAWMNNGNTYWAGDLVGMLFDSECVYAKGDKAFNLAKHPSMIVMYDDSFWKGGAEISVEEDALGNTEITSITTIKNSAFGSVVNMEVQTTFVYKDGQVLSIVQITHMTGSFDWNGHVEEIDETQTTTCIFDYADVELEVPEDIKSQEADATKADIDEMVAMMQSMVGM